MTLQDLFHISYNHGYIPQILCAMAVFLFGLKRRELFWWRLGVGLPIFALCSIVIPNVVGYYTSGFFSFIIFLLAFAFSIILFDDAVSNILFCCVGAQLMQNFSYHVENLIHLPLQDYIGNVGRVLLSVGVMLVVYAIVWWIVARRIVCDGEVHIDGKWVFPLAILVAGFVYFIQFFMQQYQIDSMWVVRLPLAVCCIFGLSMMVSWSDYKREEEENKQLERLIIKQNEQFESTRTSIDIINMKAHDLKYFINKLYRGGDLEKREVDEIASVVEEYDNTVDTGNKTLDIVLTEKQYVCKRENIFFSVIAQGAVLEFMSAADIVALFENALDNAIESQLKVSPEKRCISLHVSQKANVVLIHIENYCVEPLQFKDGLPITSKGDEDYHGYGLKSIRYIVKKYDGSMMIKTENGLFALNILLPIGDFSKVE